MSPLYLKIFFHQFGELFFIEIQFIYKILLVLGIYQSDSVSHTQTHIILFHYGLLQDIEYSALCYTVRPCSLFTLYVAVRTC